MTTAAELKAKFPALGGVDDAVVTAALAEAAPYADDRWVSDADRVTGQMLYAAHILTLDGHGTSTEAQMAKAGTLGFTTMKSGNLSLTRNAPQADKPGSDTLGLTTFGTRYMDLARRNLAGSRSTA